MEAGMYKVGTDIPAGEYIVFSEQDLDSYLEVSKTNSGKSGDIIVIESLADMYNRYVKVEDGQYLELKSCYALPEEKAGAIDIEKATMLKVGRDIQPGEYQLLVREDEFTWFSSYNIMEEPLDTLDAIRSEDIENNVYVTLEDGNYLWMSGCYLDESSRQEVAAAEEATEKKSSKTTKSKKKAKTKKTDTYMFPNSDSAYLTDADLLGLSQEELRIAKNEIYARHGYIFQAEDLQKYFKKKSWYSPTVKGKDFDDSVFNKYEKANIEFIVELQS